MNNMKKTLIDEKEWPHCLKVSVDAGKVHIECYPVSAIADIESVKIKVIKTGSAYLAEYIAALRFNDVTVHLAEEHALQIHAELPEIAFTSAREVAA